MNYNLGALLSFLVAFQLFFVALYLFTHKKGNRRNNSLLGLLFLLFSMSLVDFTLRVSGIILPIPLLHLIDDGFFLLYGPLIYFYVLGVVYRDFMFRKRDLLHLIPYLCYTTFIVYNTLFIDVDAQAEVTSQVDSGALPAWLYLLGMFFYAHALVYLWFSWRTLKKYKAIIKDKYSSIGEINLEWLSFMIKTFTVIASVALVHNVVPVLGGIFFQYASVLILLMITFYFINRVLIKALNQPAIFSGIALNETEKYASSSLKHEELEKYKRGLESLMQEEKLYLDAELTSQELAEKLKISPKLLSQVINQGFDRSFFDFVNSYRCEEVKRLLKGPDTK